MKTSTVAALIVVALCVVPRSTSAQPYATLAAGVSQNDVECTNSPTCEKTDAAFKVLGGYRIAPWIAGEAVYLDFGAALKASRFAENHYATSMFGGGVALRGNFASWTITGRVGAARVASEIEVTFRTANSPPSSSTTNSLMPYGGAELGYRFSTYVELAVGVDVTTSSWKRSDGVGLEWNAGAVTAGVTIGR
jgi:hypothetical protein